MAEYQEVVDAGPGWTRVRTSDGRIVTVEGNRNWRNNNPGNLEYGDFAKSMGAIGTDGRFAVFPSYDAGRAAKERLIFESPNYRDLPLSGAISRYAPSFENDTAGYLRQVVEAAGVSPDTPMNAIPAEKRAAVLDAMQRVEGWKVGTIDGAPVNQPVTAYAPQKLPPIEPPALAAINRAAPTPQPALMRSGSKGGAPGRGFVGPLMSMVADAVPQAGKLMRAAQRSAPQIAQGALAPMMGTVAGRTAIMRALMPSNIGAAPSVMQGRVAGGSPAMAVRNGAATPVTLMRAANAPSERFDAAYHPEQDMNVYRANRDAIGAPITQASIMRAADGGATLFRRA